MKQHLSLGKGSEEPFSSADEVSPWAASFFHLIRRVDGFFFEPPLGERSS